MSANPAQTNLLNLHPCPQCNGTGHKTNHETGDQTKCRVCAGTGQINYDPNDKTIPY